jgi:hypothetical protein
VRGLQLRGMIIDGEFRDSNGLAALTLLQLRGERF